MSGHSSVSIAGTFQYERGKYVFIQLRIYIPLTKSELSTVTETILLPAQLGQFSRIKTIVLMVPMDGVYL